MYVCMFHENKQSRILIFYLIYDALKTFLIIDKISITNMDTKRRTNGCDSISNRLGISDMLILLGYVCGWVCVWGGGGVGGRAFRRCIRICPRIISLMLMETSIHAYYFPLGECRELHSHWPVLSKPGYAIFHIFDYTNTLLGQTETQSSRYRYIICARLNWPDIDYSSVLDSCAMLSCRFLPSKSDRSSTV